jgi:streptogramin lyase
VLSAGFKGGGIVHPQGIAVDGVGNVWVANYRGPAISELAGINSIHGAGTVLSPAAGWAPDAGLLEAFALDIDASGNIWVTSFGNNQLNEYIGLAAPVKTPLLGPVRVP